MRDMRNRVDQLEAEMSKGNPKGYGKLPSQPKVNPKQNVIAITLQSEKELK